MLIEVFFFCSKFLNRITTELYINKSDLNLVGFVAIVTRGRKKQITHVCEKWCVVSRAGNFVIRFANDNLSGKL